MSQGCYYNINTNTLQIVFFALQSTKDYLTSQKCL